MDLRSLAFAFSALTRKHLGDLLDLLAGAEGALTDEDGRLLPLVEDVGRPLQQVGAREDRVGVVVGRGVRLALDVLHRVVPVLGRPILHVDGADQVRHAPPGEGRAAGRVDQ
jgi:hypothetical protein